MMSLLAIQIQETQAPEALPTRVFAPVKTADAHIMIPLVSLKSYLSVFGVIGHADWKSNPDYTSTANVMRRRAEIDAAVADWAASRSTRECEAALTAAGVACSIYAAPADLFDDVHLRQRGVFAGVDDAAGRFSVLNPPFRLSGVDCAAQPVVARPAGTPPRWSAACSVWTPKPIGGWKWAAPSARRPASPPPGRLDACRLRSASWPGDLSRRAV